MVSALRERARSFDREAERSGRPVREAEAIEAYEELVANEFATIDDYLNLLAIHMLNAIGYPIGPVVPDAYRSRYAHFAHEIPAEMNGRYGANASITFWKLYAAWVCGFGDMCSNDECLALAETGEAPEAYFYLFVYGSYDDLDYANRYQAQAMEIYGDVRVGDTTRQRWVKWMLETAFDRLGVTYA